MVLDALSKGSVQYISVNELRITLDLNLSLQVLGSFQIALIYNPN